jgi:hypothetical protein
VVQLLLIVTPSGASRRVAFNTDAAGCGGTGSCCHVAKR